ncbi:hypothetical protein DY000_02053523 [Brassica cretica]|uniref:Retrotransposon gag domain-containing protein n=1 Tax=Brassica cretica TaxID=69181 RepID=A0ABQ7A834_BRACR|nr:hypothetical protein DY000_02053523 [Brassica cretica]
MSTRSNKGIWLLLVEPLDLERVIHKSKRVVDTLQAAIVSVEIQASIDTIHPASIDTVHPMSINIVQPTLIGTIQLVSDNIVHNGTVHREKIEVLIHKVDENGMLRDEEGHTSNSAGQLINAQGVVISDVIVVAEINNFDLSREWDAFRWFSQLQPGSLTSWDDIERAFLYKFLDDAEATGEKEKNDKWDRFLALLDEKYMISIQRLDDIMVKRDEQHVSGELSRVEEAGTEDSTSTSTNGRTSTSTDGRTSTSTNGRTSTPQDGTTSMSTDGTTSTSTEGTTSMSTGGTTSTSIYITTSTSIDDVDREITMEDSLELEEWLEDMDQNSKKKLDDDQHTSRRNLETSKASIGRHQPDDINRQPPHIIDLHPPDIDRHRQPLIDRHHPPNIDRCPLLDIPPCCIIEMEPIEERMYMSKASHLIVVPCAVFEAESPIPPDRSMQFNSYIEVLDDHQHVEASQKGLRFRDEVDKGPAEAASIDTGWIPSNDTNKPASIDAITSPSIDTGRISEQKEFDVCVEILGMEIPPHDQTSLGERRGGIGRREKGSWAIPSYH